MIPRIFVSYLLTFSRTAVGLVFTISSLSKLRDFQAFEQAIRGFQILPGRLNRVCACLFLAGEGAVVGLLSIGIGFLMPGFLLAVVLLSLFCIALLLVLLRGIQTPCSCFGSSHRPVSPFDVWRNISFILCACLGVWSVSVLWDKPIQLSLGETGLLVMMAIGFVVFSISLGEMIQLFHVLSSNLIQKGSK